MIVNISTNINKTISHPSPQNIKHHIQMFLHEVSFNVYILDTVKDKKKKKKKGL